MTFEAKALAGKGRSTSSPSAFAEGNQLCGGHVCHVPCIRKPTASKRSIPTVIRLEHLSDTLLYGYGQHNDIIMSIMQVIEGSRWCIRRVMLLLSPADVPHHFLRRIHPRSLPQVCAKRCSQVSSIFSDFIIRCLIAPLDTEGSYRLPLEAFIQCLASEPVAGSTPLKHTHWCVAPHLPTRLLINLKPSPASSIQEAFRRSSAHLVPPLR